MDSELLIRFAGKIRLDTPYFGLSPERARDRRREERATLTAFVDAAAEAGVHYVVFTGDLYSAENLSFETAEFLLDLFEGHKSLRFVILPGLSDPADEDSLYRSGRLPSNVSVFTEEGLSRVDFPDASFYGTATASPAPALLAEQTASDDGRLQVLLLYSPTVSDALLAAAGDFAADVTLLAGGDAAGYRVHKDAPLMLSTGFSVGKTAHDLGDGVYTELRATAGDSRYALALSSALYTNRRYLSATLDLSGVHTLRDVQARLEDYITSLPHISDSYLLLTLTGELPVTMLLPSTPESYGLYGLTVCDDTRPTAGTEVLMREMSVRGELYRSLSPGFSEEDDEDRKTVIESFRLGLRAIDDREAE